LKKIIQILLITALLWTTSMSNLAFGANPNFTDTKGHWAESNINQLVTKGYLNGYGDNTFRPDKPMTRAEFIKVLSACLQLNPIDTQTSVFKDTAQHWALAQINETVKQGILVPSEYPTGLEPNGYIKRSEAAAMMARALSKQTTTAVHTFADQTTVNKSMYRDFIQVAYAEQLMSGYSDNTFKPFGNLTRAEVCTIMVKLMEKMGTSTTPIINLDPTNPNQQNLTTLILDDKSYDIAATPISLRFDTQVIKITNLTQVDDYVYANYIKRLALDSTASNPQIIIYNKCYDVKKFKVDKNSLIAESTNLKLLSISYADYNYNSEFINLYIGNENHFLTLADAEIVDSESVKIDGQLYNLATDQITIAFEKDFFRLNEIIIDASAATLKMSKTSPVVIEHPDLADVSAIFDESTTVDLDEIDHIDLIIENNKYALSEVTIDAAGNISNYDQKIYPPAQITMLVGDNSYGLEDIKMTNGKLMFFCTDNDVDNWVKINDEYYDQNKVKILLDNVTYNLNQVLVIKRDVLRISGKQYNLSSNIKCRLNNKLYDINRIDFDVDSGIVSMKLTEFTNYPGSIQPLEYVFYLDEEEYLDGDTDSVEIKVDGSWIEFDQIIVTDPAHFSYDDSAYDLLQTRLRIDEEEFIVIDTSWRGATQVFSLYLQEY